MPALTETRDEDDDDGRAALYRDSGTDENEELDDKDADGRSPEMRMKTKRSKESANKL